ncbi:MAG: chemotaxis protein CheW [Gemmatimonadota bacterium]
MLPTPVLTPDTALTPAEPNGTPTVLRFRERVRARTGTAELLAFRVGGERFAFDVRALDEAIDAPPLERSPFAPPTDDAACAPRPAVGSTRSRPEPSQGTILRGISRVGTRSIPIFDTARLLGVCGAGAGAHVLVMRSGARRIGLIADEVDDVITIDVATIKPPPVDVGDELLLGVTWDGDEVTGVLDARALIAACQQRSVEVAW